jgi:hypothetical protein
VPPTHKHFEIEVMHWYKIRDGKIVDRYGARDDVGMMEQLGLLAEPQPNIRKRYSFAYVVIAISILE